MKVRLLDIAHARSGDKGDTANVGVIALQGRVVSGARALRDARAPSPATSGTRSTGRCERFELPNLLALNFLLHGALGGGGTVSLKTDAQGKVFSTALLRLVIDVPDDRADARAPGGAAMSRVRGRDGGRRRPDQPRPRREEERTRPGDDR